MAQDGCQPMERFAFAKNGSAQKSWASCPSSRNAGYGGAAPGAAPGGTYETRPYSVSGYVNGYNPSLPAYPPTRAQLEAAAKRAVAPPSHGGYGGEIADMMSAQIRFEQARASGGAPPVPAGARGVSTLSETSGGLKYSGHGAWDGPAPRGDPTKPPPGAPYYVKAPPEPVHDPSKEEREIPLGGAAGLRLPVLGCDSAHAAHAVPLGYRHVRCGAADDPNLATAGDAVRAAPGGRDAIFISAKIAPGDVSDPAAACDAILASLRVAAVDLLSLEWPVGDADALKATWSKLEALVRAGKARAIGLTNASVPVVEAICGFAEMKPAVNEVEAHPLMAHRKLAGVCRRYGVAPAAHHPLGALDARLLQHPKLVEAAAATAEGETRRGVEALLARWSAQRGVPFVVDPEASRETVEAAAKVHEFRLTNAQKVAIDAMEPPPREGGVRFVHPPEGSGFAFDDPFLGGAARAGLELEKKGLL